MRLKTNVKLAVLEHTKLRDVWAQIVNWAPRQHAQKRLQSRVQDFIIRYSVRFRTLSCLNIYVWINDYTQQVSLQFY